MQCHSLVVVLLTFVIEICSYDCIVFRVFKGVLLFFVNIFETIFFVVNPQSRYFCSLLDDLVEFDENKYKNKVTDFGTSLIFHKNMTLT
jgi:hypothetical protein